MHHANHFYGHAHVMATYCGVATDPPPRMRGYLQHGWNIGDALAPHTKYVAGSPIFVWSEQARRRARWLGRSATMVTGSPWIYLLALQPDHTTDNESRTGTIWYPFHGWEEQKVMGSHRNLIAEIKATEPGPVTICLYWTEYQDRRIRKVYEKAGFRIVCHGYRGYWWHRTDPEFLYRQLAELRAHKRVASNRLTSAIFYGVLAGCAPAVYGDPMLLHNEDTTYGGYARIRRQWSYLHGASPDEAVAREVSHEELGSRYLAHPAELKEILGWSGLA